MTDHDVELDAIVATLSEAGMVEEFTDEDGKPAMRLTPQGEQVARQMALSREDDAAVLLDALLDWSGPSGP